MDFIPSRESAVDRQFTDTRESIASTLEHGALTAIIGKTDPHAMTTVITTRTVFESAISGRRTLADAMKQDDITVLGSAKAVSDLFTLLVDFETGFPVVEPNHWTVSV